MMSVASEYTLVSTWRKISLIGGLLSIALGLILMVWPGKTVLVLTALVGVWLLVLGVTRLADVITRRRQDGAANAGRLFGAFAGAIYLCAGVLVLANLDGSLRYMAVLFGVIWICAGLSEAVDGLARVGGAWVRTAAVLTGLINISIGILVLVLPGISLLVLAEIAAIWLILLGVIQLYASYKAHRAERELKGRPS